MISGKNVIFSLDQTPPSLFEIEQDSAEQSPQQMMRKFYKLTDHSFIMGYQKHSISSLSIDYLDTKQNPSIELRVEQDSQIKDRELQTKANEDHISCIEPCENNKSKIPSETPKKIQPNELSDIAQQQIASHCHMDSKSTPQFNGTSSNCTTYDEEMKQEKSEEAIREEQEMIRKNRVPRKIYDISLSQRKDKFFRAIIRKMKGYFKREFNSQNNYTGQRKNARVNFIIKSLQSYIENLVGNLRNLHQYEMIENYQEFKKELQFLLGSMFYVKDYIRALSKPSEIIEAKQIHKAFETFSIGKLQFLGKFLAFRVILHYYLDNFYVLQTRASSQNSEEQTNQQHALDYLMKVYLKEFTIKNKTKI